MIEIPNIVLGETKTEIIDFSAIESESYIDVSAIPSRGYPGTKILVEHLWRKAPQSKTVTAIRAYLPSIYRSYLNPELNENGFICTIKLSVSALYSKRRFALGGRFRLSQGKLTLPPAASTIFQSITAIPFCVPLTRISAASCPG